MNSDIVKAKQVLMDNDYTCVLCLNEKIYHSSLRGVKPLIDFLESGVDFSKFSAADKVVGAGAAHLYVLLGVREVFARVISDAAKKILIKNGISVSYEDLVPFIINRAGNGNCPIENAVKEITDSSQALVTIKETLDSLK